MRMFRLSRRTGKFGVEPPCAVSIFIEKKFKTIATGARPLARWGHIARPVDRSHLPPLTMRKCAAATPVAVFLPLPIDQTRNAWHTVSDEI